MSPIRMERVESAARVVISFNDAFNRHDVAGMTQLVSEDCTYESSTPAPGGTQYSGKAAITRFWQDFFPQYPQAHRKIEEIFGFGIRCIALWKCDWVDAAGAPAHVRGIDIFRVQDGLIIEEQSYVKA